MTYKELPEFIELEKVSGDTEKVFLEIKDKHDRKQVGYFAEDGLEYKSVWADNEDKAKKLLLGEIN